MSSCVLSVSFAWNGCALRTSPRVLETEPLEQLPSSAQPSSVQTERSRLTTVTVRDGPLHSLHLHSPPAETESHPAAGESVITRPACEASSSNIISYFIVEIDAPFFGDAPPPGAVRGDPCDGLWNYEVVELFIAYTTPTVASMQSCNSLVYETSISGNSLMNSTAVGASVGPAPHYLELELSPHGAHLVLQLDDVRHVFASQLPLPYSHTRVDGDRWHGVL